MRILVVAINAKYIHSNPAVYSLKKNAGVYEDSVIIAEYTINNSLDHILRDIYSKKSDVICFSCYIWNINLVEELSETLAKLCPNVDVWLGGPEVSYDTEEYLDNHPYIKGIMIGEGEDTFYELCKYYSDKTSASLENIAGLSFIENGHIIRTLDRDCPDFDKLPFYCDSTDDFENRIIYYESSRGCPFSCSYCLSSIDKRVRFKSLEKVYLELSFFLKNKVKQVKFIDRTFNINNEYAFNIWKFIAENDNSITNFHFEISADLLTDEQIKLLNSMRKGLVQLEIGVQSTNEITLKEIQRNTDINKLCKNVRAISSGKNIHQHLDLIAGLPFEDYTSFRKSFNDIISLRPNQLQLGFLKVLKGTLMHEKSVEYDLVYKKSPPYEVLCTKWLSFDEMIKIKGAEETLEIYYNSGQYFITMEIILRLIKSPFDFFVNFGKFYFDKGYNSMSFSRIARCEKLLEFIESGGFKSLESFEKPDISMIKEALIYDLYAREKCKSRPSWAVDKEAIKEMTKRYCKKPGTKTHIEPFNYNFDSFLRDNNMPEKLDKSQWVLFDYDNNESHIIGVLVD